MQTIQKHAAEFLKLAAEVDDNREPIEALEAMLALAGRMAAMKAENPEWEIFLQFKSDASALTKAVEAARGLSRAKAPTKRRNRASYKSRPVTPKQAEAVQIVGECKGNLAQAAHKLGKDRSTIVQLYNAGMRNAGMTARNFLGKPRTQRLPHDRRGQAIVPDEE